MAARKHPTIDKQAPMVRTNTELENAELEVWLDIVARIVMRILRESLPQEHEP